MESSPWNSLEVAKLVVGVAAPIAVAVVGFYLSRALKRVEDAQWADRTVVERRLDLFDEMAPLLNDLYCFFFAVGHYREVTPPKAIETKRQLDRLFYTRRPLMSDDFCDAYEALMDSAFQTFTGLAQNAKLRTSWKRQRAERAETWSEDWSSLFSADSQISPLHELDTRYHDLMDAFAIDVAVPPTRQRGPIVWDADHQYKSPVGD